MIKLHFILNFFLFKIIQVGGKSQLELRNYKQENNVKLEMENNEIIETLNYKSEKLIQQTKNISERNDRLKIIKANNFHLL